jgi:Tol biopolymer transport system component/DNA-binding winged helix-turn-helix (wHTH) protein
MFEVASAQIFEFGEFRLDNSRRLLTRNGEVVPLTHKAFETLALLVENRGRIVEKDELLREIWPDTFVEEGSLARNISVLRKALGEGPSDHHYIQTIPKQGYRFVATVREVIEPSAAEFLDSDPPQFNGTDQADIEKPATAPRNYMPYAVAAGVIAAMIVTAVALYLSAYPVSTPMAKPTMNITRFTSTGKAMDAAISRDGKYVVYVINDGGKQSLWVKQVASGSEVQIVPPADVNFQGLAFSSDGNYVFYNIWDKVHVGEIYRIPVLGGTANRVVNDVMPMMSVSPDDREIVFVRSLATANETHLIAARTDGSGERIISQIGPVEKGWFGGPVWSPDGKWIAFALGGVGEQGQSFVQVAKVPAEGGERQLLSDRKFLGIGSLGWHSNGRDLILTASEQIQIPNQLWRLNSATGEATRLSNDLNGYNGLSLTADTRALVTTQGDFQSNIYVGGESADSQWKRLTSGRYEGMNVTWTPDGRVVYVSQESGNDDIWIMNSDGSGRKRLTTDPSIDANPAVTYDGKTIVFASLRSGVPHLYKMSIDGGEQIQITDGPGEWAPIASPTEPYVVFQSSPKRGIWKIDLNDGKQSNLNDAFTYLPAFSADGKRIIFSYWDDRSKPERLRQAYLDLATGQQIELPPVPRSAIRHNSQVTLRWTSDGRSYAYIDDRDGVSNIWRQPLDGGPPQEVSTFNDSYIYTFDWSRDGKIAVARGNYAFDVVLVTDFE